MSQTVDGVKTSYVLDTATPLAMVLAETTGTETIYYLHGLDLVAQNDGLSTEYFGYDGLGSVRQMLDDTGNVLFAQAFDPYGNPYASAGTSNTSWGFTGEQTDSNGLIFLRARYYNSQQGRFLQRDPWRGNLTKSLSQNQWLYVFGNPVNITDPSGKAPPPPTTPPGTPEPPSIPTPPVYPPIPSPLPVPFPPCPTPSPSLRFPPTPPSRGIMEGESIGGGVGSGTISGREILYHFASMTRARFGYEGTLGGILASFGGVLYAGPIYKFTWRHEYEGDTYRDYQIDIDYRGPTEGWYLGAGVGEIASLGGGIGYFHSANGPVWGVFNFVFGGIGLLPIEVVSFRTNYVFDKSFPVEYYADSNGEVNLSLLIGDILSGDGSPTGPRGHLWPGIMQQRWSAVPVAIIEAQKYEAYYDWYSLNNQ